MTQHEKMLERVRALLAKADSTDFPEEAESFRAKADELMTKYAIEMWQVHLAQDSESKRSSLKPIRKDINVEWWYNYNSPYEVRSALYSIFAAVARHCRCLPVASKTDYKTKLIPVIGLEPDLAYLDILFTHLYVQMAKAMDPHPEPGESLVDALVRMKEAGLKWEECHRRLKVAGMVEDEPWSKRVASKMDFAGKYTRYCREHGRDRTYVTPSVYQRSFVDGFVIELRHRLRNQEEQQGQNTGSMAIALQDIADMVRNTMWDMFPDLRPHPDDCDCDYCHSCNDPKCNRPNCKAKRSRRAPARVSTVLYDYGVAARGRKAGADVTIISDAPQVKRRKELS